MKLIDYLPPRLADIKEIADIQEAIEPEIHQIERIVEQYLINRNPLRANREGIEIWEEWLKITPEPGDSLKKRGERILAQLNERLPYTMGQLYRMLTGILGEDNFHIDSPEGKAILHVDINVFSDVFDSVLRLLQHVVPAHILWILRSYLDTKIAEFTTSSFLSYGITITLEPFEVSEFSTRTNRVISSANISTGNVLTLEPDRGN